MDPRTINVGAPNENGDVESLNRHLKRRIRKHLLVRGGSDLASLELYDAFLDRFEVIALDDIGYVQQSREEMEVLFTFLTERYERRKQVWGRSAER